ncbi:MAG: dTMP kinase [Desulfobacterium sp.]|nr:dTMP kinase [Desulfobacterium sp.]MBU3948547.1 dTMP kinase [Pseudomonadota bacterium]MBU4009525.1 dTMP kinase [Pseudomonadota bacterium]
MFITFEGIEGSGKTTQIRHAMEFLKQKGKDCVMTREPGGTITGQKIRSILLDPESNGMDPSAELLLYFADRAEHVNKIINPALSAGKTVLCDRYYDATKAYQGYARGLNMDLLDKLHKMIIHDLKPDITILLDLDPKTGLSRAWKQINEGQRAGVETRFEKETLDFHDKVRKGYLELARIEAKRFVIVDASKDENQVKKDIIKALS